MEKQILTDALASQKFSTSCYNTWAGECDNPQLRGAMMEILKDEHAIQNEVFTIMKTQGLYPLKQATAQEINEVVSAQNQG